jgi:hypothetical protein
VQSSKDGRAAIQNGFWGPKIVGWLAMVVITFLIPDKFFIVWGNYVALVGAILFLLLGLILLVDLAHTWAEHCIEKIDATESKTWQVLLVGSTASMYLASIAMTIVMYIFFAKSGCSMNQAAITVSAILYWYRNPANLSDQLSLLPWNFNTVHSPDCPILQPSRWTLSIGNGWSILHLSHHVSRRNGTR